MLRAVRRAVWPVCLAVALGAPAGASGQSLRTVPLDHWAYGVADEILLRHPALADGVWLGNRPWREADFRLLLERARDAGLTEPPSGVAGALTLLERAFPAELRSPDDLQFHNEVSLRLAGYAAKSDVTFDPPFLGIRFEEPDGDPPNPALRAVAQHDFAVQFRDRFALGWRYAIDSDVTNDPTRFRQIEARDDSDYGFALLDAYATYRYGPLWITAGRNELSLGPAARSSSVYVSDSIPPLDQLRFTLGTRTVRFTGLIGRLSGDDQNRLLGDDGRTIPGSDPPPAGDRRAVDRILYLHRVDWQPHSVLQLAISESALVTGVDRGLETRYANLLIPFFVTQEDEDEPEGADVNVMVNAEGVVLVPGGVRVWFDVFTQEFFVDRSKREEVGNQLAWKLGGLVAGDMVGLPALTAGLEYNRVDVFTYLHRGLNTNYSQFGVPIGSSLGPDADRSEAWLSWRPRPELRVTASAALWRDGERDLETLESVTDAGNPDFPSGVVQRAWQFGVEAWGMLPRYGAEGVFRLGTHDLTGIDHETGRDERFWVAELGLRVRHDFASSGS